MKLLFDENLSPRSALRLSDAFPGSSSVEALRMRGCRDEDIFRFAAEQGFVVVSKDNDFQEMSLVHGAPPKVVWLRVGNASPSAVEWLLRREVDRLLAFERHPMESLLVLDLPR